MKIVQKITSPLDCPDFIATHRQQPQDFTRRRQLTFKNLVLFLLNQPRTALQTELDQFYRVLNQASAESQVVTAQAFSKARGKLKPEVFERLNQTLQHQIDSLGLRQRWRGLRLLAIDGSTVHLPLEPAMGRFFGLHGEQPTARLSALHDVMDGQTLHSLIVPPNVGERDCAHLHLEYVPANSLTLFDRGYPGHWLFALFEQQQRHFLMRLPCGYNAQVKQFLRSGQAEDTLAFAAAHPEARLFCTEAGVDPAAQVKLRLIRVELASGESEVLVTSLLDRQAFPVEVFADLYHRRWGIETDYRRLKQTLCLDNFSGRSVIAVQQDFHATPAAAARAPNRRAENKHQRPRHTSKMPGQKRSARARPANAKPDRQDEQTTIKPVSAALVPPIKRQKHNENPAATAKPSPRLLALARAGGLS